MCSGLGGSAVCLRGLPGRSQGLSLDLKETWVQPVLIGALCSTAVFSTSLLTANWEDAAHVCGAHALRGEHRRRSRAEQHRLGLYRRHREEREDASLWPGCEYQTVESRRTVDSSQVGSWSALGRYSLKLRPEKCKLFQKKVKFLGHEVSSQGVAPDLEKVVAIQSWTPSTTVKQVRSFFGFLQTTAITDGSSKTFPKLLTR